MIGADYTNPTLRPTKIQFPHHPHLQNRVYKYEFSPSELPRGARNAFRLYGVFLDLEAKPPIMYLIQTFFKGDEEDITKSAVDNCVKRLQAALANPGQDDDEEEESALDGFVGE